MHHESILVINDVGILTGAYCRLSSTKNAVVPGSYICEIELIGNVVIVIGVDAVFGAIE